MCLRGRVGYGLSGTREWVGLGNERALGMSGHWE
jgi:hypothetical protein